MPMRRSDVIEMIGERVVTFSILGVLSAALGALFYFYKDLPYGGYAIGLAWVLLVGGVVMVLFSVYCSHEMRKVTSYKVQCPFCSGINVLTAQPEKDFKCGLCHREVPIKDGQVLPVFQVRCGYCNELNFYSEKNDVLICEKCDHEIPLTIEEGKPVKHVPKAYAVSDDERLYELTLVGHGGHREELIAALQHMLALNRNQVKQLLDEVPVTLLTGISKKKAELLQAQLALHDGAAEFHPLS